MKLTPTEELILEVLAARYRLGETLWTFNSRHSKQLDHLEKLGLIWGMHGVTEHTLRAGLTDDGKMYVLSDTYEPPTVVGTQEFAVESKTLLGGPWDRIDDGRGWSDRYGRPYSKKEAREEVKTRSGAVDPALWKRVVTRTVTDWTPLEKS